MWYNILFYTRHPVLLCCVCVSSGEQLKSKHICIARICFYFILEWQIVMNITFVVSIHKQIHMDNH